MTRAARLEGHDFRGATCIRWRRHDEPEWVGYLRGIILCLKQWKTYTAESRAFFAEHQREAREHLKAVGLTLTQAKALVFPEPEKLSKALRRSYGLRAVRRSGSKTTREGCARRVHRNADREAESTAAADGADAPPPPPPPERAARTCGPDGLPLVFYAEDLAHVFGVSVATARRHLVAGDYGRRFKIGRRWAVRAATLWDHLEAIEERPPGACSARRDPAAARFAKRLRNQRRRPPRRKP